MCFGSYAKCLIILFTFILSIYQYQRNIPLFFAHDILFLVYAMYLITWSVLWAWYSRAGPGVTVEAVLGVEQRGASGLGHLVGQADLGPRRVDRPLATHEDHYVAVGGELVVVVITL